MKDDGGGNWAFTVVETTDDDGLDAITIDEILAIGGIDKIDLLKIDIEGAERNCLVQITRIGWAK
ncbi:MAG: FkbM family methyltransferase [Saprospiraceae bacterium]|nr:FkbM family methyltransferase [Saprospiraceae bacterium]